MRTCLKRFSVMLLVSLAVAVLLSTSVFAGLETPPYVLYSGGSFNYNASTNELTISGGTIGTVAHADGSFAFNQYMDSVWGGTFAFTGLFNGDNTGTGENWSFAPSSSSSPDFTLFDYYGTKRFTAEINGFTVVQNGSLFEVNVNFDQYNVGNINTYSGNSSEFIDDVNAFPVPWGNLYMKFNFSGAGATDFTVNQFGTVTGALSVVPEPASTMLFVAGSAVLAFRRYKRKFRQSS